MVIRLLTNSNLLKCYQVTSSRPEFSLEVSETLVYVFRGILRTLHSLMLDSFPFTFGSNRLHLASTGELLEASTSRQHFPSSDSWWRSIRVENSSSSTAWRRWRSIRVEIHLLQLLGDVLHSIFSPSFRQQQSTASFRVQQSTAASRRLSSSHRRPPTHQIPSTAASRRLSSSHRRLPTTVSSAADVY